MVEGSPTLTVAGPVATIQLNRPEDLAEFSTLLGTIEADPALRVLVVTATGKSFSSGYNIGKMDGQRGRGGVGSFEELTDRLERLTLPTIAALNGSVYGGSTDLALACEADPALIAANVAHSQASADLHEGQTAWLEKRKPAFTGR